MTSVRKIIKFKLLSLLKHPASLDFQPQITTLLTDLGATQAEVEFLVYFVLFSISNSSILQDCQTSTQSSN